MTITVLLVSLVESPAGGKMSLWTECAVVMRSYGRPDLPPATDMAGPLLKGFRPSGQDKENTSGKPESHHRPVHHTTNEGNADDLESD